MTASGQVWWPWVGRFGDAPGQIPIDLMAPPLRKRLETYVFGRRHRTLPPVIPARLAEAGLVGGSSAGAPLIVLVAMRWSGPGGGGRPSAPGAATPAHDGVPPMPARASDGAEAVRVDFDALPPLVEAAVAAESPALLFEGHSNVATDNQFGAGEEEIERAMAVAAVVVEGRYRQQRLIPTPMEPRAVLVRPEDGGRLTIWVSHQAQHRMRDGIARA